MENRKQMTTQEAADVLGVCYGTVQNWIKAGRIGTADRSKRPTKVCSREILRLKQAIDTGTLPYLQSRRNKSRIGGFSIPANYLLRSQSLNLVHQLLLLAKQIDNQQRIFILLELYLKLLLSKGSIRARPLDENSSLMEQWLVGTLDLGAYYPIVSELYGQIGEIHKETLSVLVQVAKLDFAYTAGEDLLGLVYMSICSMDQRKAAGSYYTPTSVAIDLISDCLAHSKLPIPRIVDPCCGSGNFLLQLFFIFQARFRREGLSDYDIEKLLLTKILNGYDNDPVAVMLTKMNLSLLTKFPELIPSVKIICRDTLTEKINSSQYDLVIGNPPWGYKFNRQEARLLSDRYYTATAGGKVESFNLFIEWAINQVVPGGFIGYVLPEAFLTVKMHLRVRKLILRQCSVKQVTCLGYIFPAVNTPVISLIIQRSEDLTNNRVKVKSNEGPYLIPQKSFSNANYSFNIFGNQKDHQILQHLQKEVKVQYLRGNGDFALGIVTGNNNKHVLSQPTPDSEPVIVGPDIFKYRLKSAGNHIVYQREKFQQVAPDNLYRANEKLLYRFINSRLIFAYDNQQYLSLNSANILIPRFNNLSLKYVLAVLNSRIAQFYHSITNPSPRILRSQLESIPIYVCNKKQENIIVQLVECIISSKNPAQRREIYEAIDEKLMDYYMLPNKYKTYITKKDKIKGLL